MNLNIILDLSSSSSSSSEDDEFLEVISDVILSESLQNSVKNEKFVEDTVPLYNERQFMQHFRLSRNIVNKLAAEFSNSRHYPRKDTGFDRIPSHKCILAFLWFSCNEAASYRTVADRFDVSISHLHTIIQNVTMFLSEKASDVIAWPSPEESRLISEEFAEMGFEGAIGCIDGTHIRIDAPSEDPDSYLNRKKYYSIQMQVVCDSKRKIRDVFIGYPGSVHDARVFRNSPLASSLGEKCSNFFLLGDSAYPCLRHLLTPYKDLRNLSNAQKNFNKKLSHCRVLVEHTIGLLKQRFRQLYHLKSRNIQFICHFIRACCVLHNFCIENDILDDLIIEDNNEEIQEQQGAPEEERNEVGLNYRNYVAAMLHI